MPTIDDFRKFEFKIAKIVEVTDHPNADKLYVIKIDAGGIEKQIVAGIKLAYTKEELVGKSVVLVDNLDSATLRGVESQGMLLAATGLDGVPILIVPEKAIEPGAKVK